VAEVQCYRHFVKASVKTFYAPPFLSASVRNIFPKEKLAVSLFLPTNKSFYLHFCQGNKEVYRQKFHPRTEIRASLADYKKTGNLHDIPLFALGALPDIF